MKKLISIILVLAILSGFSTVSFAAEYDVLAVSATFDGTAKGSVSVIHYGENDYPMIALAELASAIGAGLSGNTLKKDKVTITFTEGSRIAGFTHADYPNRADYMTTYYKNTSNVLTDESEYKTASIATSLIPGETTDKSLPADYTNDGTDGDNDGYILEYAPFSYGGKLYVPLYSIVPTLNYHTEYFRFDSTPNIKITTGVKALPANAYVVSASEYGAVGDGITDDREAILKGFYDAVMHQGPSKFVLEAGKTYRVSERVDSDAFFFLYDKDDFVFDGNGSTILFSTPVNSSIQMRSCKNITFKNVTFMYDDHTGTHGQIESVNTSSKTLIVRIADTVSEPADKAWMDNMSKTYNFGQAYDIESKRPKFITPDHFDISSVEHLGDKRVKITLTGDTANLTYMNKLKAGDGFVMNNRANGYDTGENPAGIELFLSRDIELDGVVLCGAAAVGVSVGLCDGNITFRNYQMRTKEGTLLASAADGIHYWRNRATLLIEDSELWNNLDDHINTKGEYGIVTHVSEDGTKICATGTGAASGMFKPGDEVVFLLRTTGAATTANGNRTICRAYVKKEQTHTEDDAYKGQLELVLDRAVSSEIVSALSSGSTTTRPVLYNVMASGDGTCIRGSRFIGSRRHAYISRSRNTIFMNNYVQNNGGSTCEASDEIGTSEGPFPDSFTIRNNRTYGDGITEASTVLGVIAVRAWRSNYTSSGNYTAPREINGTLIQGNIIQVNTSKCSIFVNSVKDLYMSNNTILWNDNWSGNEYTTNYSNYKPVHLVNCEIKEFKNLTYQGPYVSTKVTTTNCTGTVSSSEIH